MADKSPHLGLIVLLAGLLLGHVPCRAQQEQLELDPPLREAFPLDATVTGVRVKYPVLLSDHVILGPQAVLHFIYLDANAGRGRTGEGDGSGGFSAPGGRHAAADAAQSDGGHPEASSGWGPGPGDPDAGIFDDSKTADAKRRKQEMQSEIWMDKGLFQDALDHATDLGTTLVYNMPAQKHAESASLDLPEGMLLAEVGGRVQVLALNERSRAYAGGIRPGDEIRSLAGTGDVKTLQDFMRDYAATKRQTRLSGTTSYAMQIFRPSAGQQISIQIAAPPAIPSFF